MTTTLPHFWIRINAAINIVVLFIASSLFASDHTNSIQMELKIAETDIAVTVYPSSNSNDLIVWLPSEHGLPDAILTLAESLAQQGSQNEIWVVDLLSSLFLPVQSSSINAVPQQVLYQLIKKIQQKTQKRIFIASSGRGALLALRASHQWLQDSINQAQFGGLILLYPNLLIKTPEPGTTAQYYPVIHAVNVPMFILQPENSPWRWQLATLQQHLINANARPYISLLPKVRDRFMFRADATQDEQLATGNLASLIQKSIHYLNSETIKRYPLPPRLKSNNKIKVTKQQSKLRPYKKDPTPPSLILKTLLNKPTSLAQQRGKVVLVNFWASWCPPCVHEMPSMEKLYQHYPRSKFTILAVNMAEDSNTINDFIQNKVHVSFPILLDHDGKALQDWQVFAFPSSFIIDAHGKIRYALFGSILWDTPEVIDIIDKLVKEVKNPG